MQVKKIQLIAFTLGLFAINAVFADKMVDTKKVIPNLNEALSTLKAHTDVPVVFPTQIPKNPTLNTLYAYVDPAQITKDSYTISVDSTSTCHGAHYCNVGSLLVATKGEPQSYKDMAGEVITKTIDLTPTQKASYTPGHAMADYWPPILEWRDGNYFYSLTWQVVNQSALIKTAQSIKPI